MSVDEILSFYFCFCFCFCGFFFFGFFFGGGGREGLCYNLRYELLSQSQVSSPKGNARSNQLQTSYLK